MLVVALAFALTIGGQLFVWRVRTPHNDVRTLLLLGTVGLFVAIVGSVWQHRGSTAFNGSAVAQIGLSFFSLWLAYCELYLAIKSQSPSSQMLLYAARHPQGVLREDLLAVVANGPAEDERVESLVNGGLVRRTSAGLEPTPAGRRLTQTITLVSRIYRLPPAVPKPRELA